MAEKHQMAESPRDMRRSVYEGDLKQTYGRLLMWQITHMDLRRLCDSIVERGAPATAIQVRDIVLMVYRYANERGYNFENPCEVVRPSSIAVFRPQDRSLTTEEIRLLYIYLDHVATAPTIRLAVNLPLLT